MHSNPVYVLQALHVTMCHYYPQHFMRVSINWKRTIITLHSSQQADYWTCQLQGSNTMVYDGRASVSTHGTFVSSYHALSPRNDLPTVPTIRLLWFSFGGAAILYSYVAWTVWLILGPCTAYISPMLTAYIVPCKTILFLVHFVFDLLPYYYYYANLICCASDSILSWVKLWLD